MKHSHLLKNKLNLKKVLEQAEALQKVSKKYGRKNKLRKSTESFLAKDIDSALTKTVNVIGSRSGVRFLSNIGDMMKIKKDDGRIIQGFLTTDGKGNWIRLNSENENKESFDITSVELWVKNSNKMFSNNEIADVKIDLRGNNINSIIDACASWLKGETTKNDLLELNETVAPESNENIVTDDEDLEKGTEARNVTIKFNEEELPFNNKKEAIKYLMQNGVEDKDIKTYIDANQYYIRNARAEVDGGAVEVIPVPDVAAVSSATAGAKGATVPLNNKISEYSNIETVYDDYNTANKMLIRDLILYQDNVERWMNTPLTEENIKKINREVNDRGTKLFLLTGNPGTGKTFTLEQALENMKYDEDSNRLLWDPENPYQYEEMPLSQSIKSMTKNVDYFISPKKITPSSLIDELFLKNGVLYILDDADGVLADKDAKNFLKGALAAGGETGGSSRSSYDNKTLVVDVNLQELGEAAVDGNLNKNERARAYKTYSIWEDIQNNGWLTDDQWNAILNGDKLYLTHQQMINIYEDPDLAQVIVGERLKNSKPTTWNYFGCMIIISNMSQSKWLKDSDLAAIYSRAGQVMDISLSPEDMITRMLQIFPSIERGINDEESKKIARDVYEWVKDESEEGYVGMLANTTKSVNTQITLRLFGDLINSAIKACAVSKELSWKEWQGYALRTI